MGNIFASGPPTFELWVRRSVENDVRPVLELKHYTEDHPSPLSDALGIFRREMNMFALGRAYVDARVLYLYQGTRRLARAEVHDGGAFDGHLRITFADETTLELFRDAKEVLAPMPDGSARWPLAQEGFDSQFDSVHNDEPLVLSFTTFEDAVD